MDNFDFYSPLVKINITGDGYLFTMLLDIVKNSWCIHTLLRN